MLVFLFSELPLFLLLAGKGKTQLILSLAAFAAVMGAAIIIRQKKQLRLHFGFQCPLTSCLFSLIPALLFYLRWHTSGRLQPAADLLKLPLRQTIILIALTLALFSLPGVDQLVRTFGSLLPGKVCDPLRTPGKKYILLFIFLTALLTMFLNSRCSPIYPINDWVDPNTMFTVGKGVLKGYVPYRDLYEQKGPLLVFIHTFGAAVSYNSFIGVWILELICCFVFLYLVYRISSVFFGEKSFILVPPVSGIVYSCFTFRAGDSAEEFSLPALAFAVWLGCRVLKQDRFPSKKDFLLLGLSSGTVFWLKYSMTGFYPGWAAVIFIYALFRRRIAEFIKGIGLIFAGVVIITIPIFAYFLLNSSLGSLLEAYFYNNLFYYADAALPFITKMRMGFYNYKKYSYLAMNITRLGMLWTMLRRQWKILVFLCLTYFCSYVFVYIGGQSHVYYAFLFTVFTIFGFLGLSDLLLLLPGLGRFIRKNYQSLSSVSLIGGMLLLCGLSINLKYLEFSREDMFQYKMKSVIEQSGVSDPSVFYYGIGDAGVNTAAELIPKLRFFCFYNNKAMAEIAEEQEKCIQNRCADFIISKSKFQNVHPSFPTYDYQGWIVGMADDALEYYHYFRSKAGS